MHIPKTLLSRGGWPAIDKVWEWSAVTSISVSLSFVISMAFFTASDKANVSFKALTALLTW